MFTDADLEDFPFSSEESFEEMDSQEGIATDDSEWIEIDLEDDEPQSVDDIYIPTEPFVGIDDDVLPF